MINQSMGTLLIILALAITSCSSQPILYPNFYEESCPQALPTIKRVVEEAVEQEKRMGASLLRLHFHDCFVNVRIIHPSMTTIKIFHKILFYIYRVVMGPIFWIRVRSL